MIKFMKKFLIVVLILFPQDKNIIIKFLLIYRYSIFVYETSLVHWMSSLFQLSVDILFLCYKLLQQRVWYWYWDLRISFDVHLSVSIHWSIFPFISHHYFCYSGSYSRFMLQIRFAAKSMNHRYSFNTVYFEVEELTDIWSRKISGWLIDKYAV